MKDKFPWHNMGLYRDDGLACYKRMPGPLLERRKKEIIKLFQENGLQITIATNLKSVDFLDVNLNLCTEKHKPYKKPNNEILYVNKMSNHPNTVLKEVPHSVSMRLQHISSSSIEFDEAKSEYEKALKKSGYSFKLEYHEDNKKKDGNQKKNEKKKRSRKIIWYNPPFNSASKVNIGQRFLKLLDKHFPPSNKLHKIFNRNTVKVSYSCTKNMKRIIQSHNSKILTLEKNEKSDKTCSCPKTKKENCPLSNKCLSSSVIYRATVKKSGKYYIGMTENDFKHRYNRHKFSFKHEKDKNATTLSQHIWDIGENITDTKSPDIKWEIVKQSYPRRTGAKTCEVCLDEKLYLLRNNGDSASLNTRAEIFRRCLHRSRHKLSTMPLTSGKKHITGKK